MHISTKRQIDLEVSDQGYALVNCTEFDLSKDFRTRLRDLQKCWDDLDPDEYYGGKNECYRVRRYSDFCYQPLTGRLMTNSHRAYFQTKHQNSYVGGVVRHFGDVTSETYENPCFRKLVDFDFSLFPIPKTYLEHEWRCHVHQIRIVVAPGCSTPVTPEGIHSDGYPFAAVHLINRQHIDQGESTVYTGEGIPLATATFTTPLDTLFLEDRKMKHYVSPISAPHGVEGWRDLLAISFELDNSPFTTDV